MEEIQRLRKLMDQEPRQFSEEELFGPTALKDRTAERVIMLIIEVLIFS